MALKLDVSKAYECMEWSFLFHMMEKFGFHDKWIAWIRQCATTFSMLIQINGHRSGFFVSSRRIRQGDPLSSYFFFRAKGFSHIIKNSNLHSLKVTRYCSVVSHLLFADDSILFSKVTEEEAQGLSMTCSMSIPWLVDNPLILKNLL